MKIVNQGKDFLIFGIINFLITNIILQLLLLFNSVWLSTFLSQMINFIIGYKLYGSYVFKVRYSRIDFIKYLVFAFFIFFINAKLIIILSESYLFSKNLASIIVIPFLVILSFMIQKYIIFRSKKY
tara:strand:- start:91 stop:468 length:378 start_codon:yes stop_codon:yes gene_type:complete